MSMVKGLAFSAVGAAIGAAAWFGLSKATGMNLWILAPVVGGGAGYGMMLATKMKGGLVPAVAAAGLSVAGVFAARFVLVSGEVNQRLAANESDAIDTIAERIAGEAEAGGASIYDDDDNLLPAFHAQARSAWANMTAGEREHYLGNLQQESNALTPLALVLDFGIFGTICTALTAASAFKCGRMTLQSALEHQGMTPDEASMAVHTLRAPPPFSGSPLARCFQDPPAATATPEPRAAQSNDADRHAA